MIIQTASEGISLAKKMETNSAQFYEDLAKRYSQSAETFQALAKENKKNISQIERSYYGVITDAIEGCYAFNLNPDNYALDIAGKDSSYKDALKRVINMEQQVVKFYTDAAEQSKSLMADVPRTFSLIARKRTERINKLKEM